MRVGKAFSWTGHREIRASDCHLQSIAKSRDPLSNPFTCLLHQEFNCVESAQDPPADPAAGDDVDERDGDGPRPAAPLPLPPLNKLASQHSEDVDTKLPEQRRVTAQIMRNWEQHKAIEDKPPSSRSEKMLRLHRASTWMT